MILNMNKRFTLILTAIFALISSSFAFPVPADELPGDKVTGGLSKSKSGLKWFDIVVGRGKMPLNASSAVVVHYTGWLADGTKFDSSVDRGRTVTIRLNQVILGWTEGVSSMRVGGKRKLIVPPHLAYGEAGSGGVIPGNATLIFDVELVDAGSELDQRMLAWEKKTEEDEAKDLKAREEEALRRNQEIIEAEAERVRRRRWKQEYDRKQAKEQKELEAILAVREKLTIPTQDQVDNLKDKANRFKSKTLVFKGFYLGMPIDDAATLIRHYTNETGIGIVNNLNMQEDLVKKSLIHINPSGQYQTLYSVTADETGNVNTYYFNEELINIIWNQGDDPRSEFIQRFIDNYNIPELAPTQVTWTKESVLTFGSQTVYSYRSDTGYEIKFFGTMNIYNSEYVKNQTWATELLDLADEKEFKLRFDADKQLVITSPGGNIIGNNLLRKKVGSGCGSDNSMMVKAIRTESERNSNFD
jgi:hypothetical protein